MAAGASRTTNEEHSDGRWSFTNRGIRDGEEDGGQLGLGENDQTEAASLGCSWGEEENED
uniref:Uncharacterized protein n=1 Tax=Cucumis melo TaxID=3656 RepID=A0A9I9D7P0_CUCME